MEVFLVALKEAVKKDYLNIDFDFYLSRRSRLLIWDLIYL